MTAEAQRKYRAAHPERIKAQQERTRQARNAKNIERQVIVLDSEGTNYADGSHHMMLIGASVSEPVVGTPDNELTTERIIEKFLLPLWRSNPNAIFVAYGLSYDVRMILRDLRPSMWLGIKSGRKWYRICDGKYSILYVKHKSGSRFHIKFNEVRKARGESNTLTIYDIGGFFDGGLVQAIENHCLHLLGPRELELLSLVVEGKSGRGTFLLDEVDYVKEYMSAELELTTILVNSLRHSLYEHWGIGLTVFDRTGIITDRMFQKHNVKKLLGDTPDFMVPLVEQANMGARIEAFAIGRVCGPVWDYDMTSAYSAALRFLPDLRTGYWEEIDGADFSWSRDFREFGIYVLRYEDEDLSTRVPQPLPARKGGTVLFPAFVREAVVWGPEARNVRHRRGTEVVRAYVYHDDGTRPLTPFVEDFLALRKSLRDAGDPAERVIKKAMAEVYGRFCQRAGQKVDDLSGDIVEFTRYFQLEYSGFITSWTRAELYRAMMHAVRAGGEVYHCNTDGFVTNVDIGGKLDMGENDGQWRVKKYQDFVVLETKIYMLHSYAGEWKMKKAGYSAYEIEPDDVLKALSNPLIWSEQTSFYGTTFDDVAVMWVDIETSRQVGKAGKRQHSGNCTACSEGISPDNGMHFLRIRT